MDNKITYNDWRDKIFELINDTSNHKIYSFQRCHKIKQFDIIRNYELFEKFYNMDLSPIDALFELEKYMDKFVRSLGEFTDSEIKEEFINRDLEVDIDLDNVPTYQLEDALDYRYDTNYRELSSMSTEELEDELSNRRPDRTIFGNFKDNLAEMLGLSNSYAYTNDEFIELIKEKLQKL